MTNNRGNTDDKDSNYSQLYETPWKNPVFPLLVIQSPPQTHHNCPHFLHLKNNIYVLKLEVKASIQKNVLNQEQ